MASTVPITVNNEMLPGLKSYKPVPEPTWGKDAGRETMVGDFSGTFVGYFTNLTLKFGKTTREQFTTLKRLLEHPIVKIKYPLEKSVIGIDEGQAYEEDFYGTAISTEKDKYDGRYFGFEITLVAIRRRPPEWL